MIETCTGSILDSGAEVIVNPVNAVGVMGAGLALQIAKRYPDISPGYREACRTGKIGFGELHWSPTEDWRWIANLVTKRHWRDRSSLDGIRLGCLALRRDIVQRMWAVTVAVPALGCGLGGLSWGDVEPVIREVLHDADFKVLLYPPQESR